MKTHLAIKKAGSISELARILGVTRQAVQQWGAFVPELRRYKLLEKRPEWFTKGQK